ncbi:MAG TPA: glycosyltransferase family 4 protein, partial [Mycobacteriales bacterium]|nr:glycosyltransferase family 4 protein [Mycobacteriales bacterium]
WHSQGGGERHSGKIAEVLSHDGVAVDLLGHREVDKDDLALHLGLDLSRCSLRIVPDKGDEELALLSRDYDLFVNGSYMSRLVPQARRNAYLCYFPTPFDADLTPWQKRLARTVGPHLTRHSGGHVHGTGWYPKEGGTRRSWAWTSGDGIVLLPAGDARVLLFDLGRPGLTATLPVTVRTDDGTRLATFEATTDFRRCQLAVPASRTVIELHLHSDTETPAAAGPTPDERTLGVAVSRLRIQNNRYGPRQRVAHNYPWLLRNPADLSFLEGYDVVMANSDYTRGWIRRLWATEADVLYPPIQVDRLHPAAQRDKLVLSVGRFFKPGLGHAKRQLEMVQIFGAAVRAGELPDGWGLHVVGGCEESQRPYLAAVRAAAAGLPIEITANAPREQVEGLLQTASVFWSATGLGEDEEAAPWAQEHFGMTTVEAMAGGCVPVVIDRAGQREIVREGVDGFRWSTPPELIARTAEVAADDTLRARLAASARDRAQGYDEAAFATRWHDIAAAHALL